MLELSGFLSVLLGAALGAVFGWWLMMKENERLGFRQFNEQQLDRLTTEIGGFVRQAASADAETLELLIADAGHVVRAHIGRDPEGFTTAEQNAVSKLATDVQIAMRTINAADDVATKLAEWDRWTDVFDGNVSVLWRHIYEQSAPGLRSLFRSY